MVVAVGLKVKLAFAAALVPTKVVKPASEYHFQLAPVPRLPPVCVRVIFVTLHIAVADMFILVAATEG